MTNIENVQLDHAINKAYATLLDAALTMGSKYHYEKLKDDRAFFCNCLDRFYQNNKTNGVTHGK